MSQLQGTNVAAPVVPFSTTDVHPSHEAAYGKGGYRSVANITERNAIPTARREVGMLVYVQAEGVIYQLAADRTNWASLSLGGASLQPAESESGPEFTYDSGLLTRIDYDSGAYKLLSYDDGRLSTIAYHRAGRPVVTKSFVYSGEILSRIDQTEA